MEKILTKEIGTSDLLDTWAAEGTIVEPSLAKKNNGWDLGEQPPHEYMNWVQNIMGRAINHILQNGIPAWNANTEYLLNNITQRNGIIYRAKQGNINSQPPNNNWQAIGPVTPKNSIEINDGAYQLVGDIAEPGPNKIYGTDETGARGFRSLVQSTGFSTGDLKWRYSVGEHEGWVRFNGKTIGAPGSGATEREDDDTEALYIHLWNEDPNLVISGGRGTSAENDYAALKRLTLPDSKNRAFFAVDGMGGTNSGRISNGNVLGATGGAEKHVLTIEEMPPHDHEIDGKFGGNRATSGFGSTPDAPGTLTTGETGGGEAHNNMPPYIIGGTVYIKL